MKTPFQSFVLSKKINAIKFTIDNLKEVEEFKDFFINNKNIKVQDETRFYSLTFGTWIIADFILEDNVILYCMSDYSFYFNFKKEN